MKYGFLIAIICLPVITVSAQAPAFVYLTEFETQGSPLAIAADTNGGIYYTVFTFAGADLTRCYYLPDPLNTNNPDNHILVDDAADTDVPAGRGFTGIAVDAEGNVYLALESGDIQTATIRKLSPAPDFQPVEEFFSGIIYGEKRYNGIDIVDENLICISTFSTVEFWDAADSTPYFEAVGGENYQRDLAYNPLTGDIYIAKNRDVHGEPVSSANLLTGGNPDNLEGYTTIASDFIPQGGAGGQYGINAQLIEYDAVNDLIIIPDHSGERSTVAFYSPSDTSIPALVLDGAESPNGPFDTPADAVAVPTPDGETIVYITDNGTNRIVVYTTAAPADIRGWEIY